MARRSTPMTPTQPSHPSKDSAKPEQVVSLVGPPAEVPQPQPVEITIGEVPEPPAQPEQPRPEVTVDEDGITTIREVRRVCVE